MKAARLFAVVLLVFPAPSAFSQANAFDEAMALFQQKRFAEAVPAFENLENARPGQTDALLFAGKSLLGLERFTEAAGAFSEYLSSHPQSDEAAYLLAYVKFRQNKAAESLNLFTAAAKIKPPRADDLKIVALDYVLLGDQSSAAHYLEQALAMQPDDVELRYYLGRVRYQQNQFALAIAAFEDVLRRDPQHVKAENNLGLSLEAMNRVNEAMAAYRQAIDLDALAAHHSEQPYLNLGILLTKLGRPSESLPVLGEAAELAPASAQIRYELGKAYFNLGQFADAQRELQSSASLAPAESSTHFLLGRLYRRLGNAEGAAREFALTEELIEAKRHAGPPMAGGLPNGP
ncbi:MAG: tetratricopeptide repeat protein [Candidatus Acidiferrum sp.]|jgi:tetratricopeptide (TPR) repeat protein